MSFPSTTAHVSLENEAIFYAARRLLATTPFQDGVIMFEFRYDAATQAFWFIDIKPRYWASIANGLNSGVNFRSDGGGRLCGLSALLPEIPFNMESVCEKN